MTQMNTRNPKTSPCVVAAATIHQKRREANQERPMLEMDSPTCREDVGCGRCLLSTRPMTAFQQTSGQMR